VTVELNHTIVPSDDKHAGAQFLADLLGLSVGAEIGPFVPVELGNGVTLDYMNSAKVTPQHYAFLVDDETFDAAYKRLLDLGVQTWADPDHTQPGEINTRWGGRGVYFPDPSGHNLEMLTRPPTDAS
jgi:catechol 2,3-dioxygenase-like lactoylglutathione lyase family enzyme